MFDNGGKPTVQAPFLQHAKELCCELLISSLGLPQSDAPWQQPSDLPRRHASAVLTANQARVVPEMGHRGKHPPKVDSTHSPEFEIYPYFSFKNHNTGDTACLPPNLFSLFSDSLNVFLVLPLLLMHSGYPRTVAAKNWGGGGRGRKSATHLPFTTKSPGLGLKARRSPRATEVVALLLL